MYYRTLHHALKTQRWRGFYLLRAFERHDVFRHEFLQIRFELSDVCTDCVERFCSQWVV